MKQREWRNVIDKTAWGDGPWQSEPDKLQWQDAATGLPCLALRNQVSGTLCGYVGAVGYPQGDAQRWLDRWEPLLDDYEAWREHIAASSLGILTEPGDWPRLRYVGFDTAHAGDVMPAMASLFDRIGLDEMDGLQQRLDAAMAQLPRRPDRWTETYKTLDYVKSECADLARQLNALGPRRSWVARY